MDEEELQAEGIKRIAYSHEYIVEQGRLFWEELGKTDPEMELNARTGEACIRVVDVIIDQALENLRREEAADELGELGQELDI